MGCDFSYEDLSKRSLKKDKFKALKAEKVKGIDCYVVEAIAIDKSEKYSKRKMWIRKDNFLTVKIHFFNKSNNLAKELTTDKITQIQKIWTINYFEMKNLEKATKTFFELSKVKYNTNIAKQIKRHVAFVIFGLLLSHKLEPRT